MLTQDAGLAHELREILGDAGYRPNELWQLLDGHGASLTTRVHLRLLRMELARDPLALLVRLFVLARPVTEGELPVAFEILGEAGVAERKNGTIRPLVRLLPIDDLLLACDLPSYARADEVIPALRESERLASLTPRPAVANALDVGTGSGYLALLAARYATRVVATDISMRALTFASFNAALNGIGNVELREGSFFEPVAGEKFDLIVSNPPYAISPDSELVYRDAGLRRDRVSELVVQGAAAALAPGGFGVVSTSWIVEDDLLERPRAWLDGTGCDAWIFHLGTETAEAAAVAWNWEAPDEDRRARTERWLDYYRAEGISSLAYGVFVLRAGAERPWLRVVRVPSHTRPQAASAHVLRMFRGVDTAVGLADDAELQPAPGASLRVRRDWDGDRWRDAEELLVCSEGIPFRREAHGDAAHLRQLVELGLLEPA